MRKLEQTSVKKGNRVLGQGGHTGHKHTALRNCINNKVLTYFRIQDRSC